MTDSPSDDEAPRPRHAGGELIIPVLAFGFTLYYFATIWDSPWSAQVNAVLVGSILFVCLALLAARIARERIVGAIDFGFADLVSPVGLAPKRLAFAGLAVAYILGLEYAGFTLSTFAFLWASFMLLHGTRRWHIDLALAATMALIGYAVFIVAFETRFPRGPFENLMRAVLP
jgi:hypothetical protein